MALDKYFVCYYKIMCLYYAFAKKSFTKQKKNRQFIIVYNIIKNNNT